MVKNNYFNRFRKNKGKAKPKPKAQGAPRMTFAQKVNQIIARNNENKITLSYSDTTPVCSQNSAGTNAWYLQKDWNTKIFTISQGAAEQQRIGNQIKLKRWVIKGIVSPSPSGAVSTTLGNTSQGYVDVYFGRLLTNGEISSALTAFYENGNTSAAPSGAMSQMFKSVNKNEYKVYFHKRFKLSPHTSQGGQATVINNDFNLVKTFGFDVTKYICKNAVIKYNDTDNDPNHDMIRRLALWATWQPAIGDMGPSVGSTFTTYYNISIQSYAEYEDA